MPRKTLLHDFFANFPGPPANIIRKREITIDTAKAEEIADGGKTMLPLYLGSENPHIRQLAKLFLNFSKSSEK